MGLLGPPGAEFLHFVIGLGLFLVGMSVARRNPLWGSILLSAITVGLAVKEFAVDPALEGASIASGQIDLLWFLIGGAVGSFLAWMTNWAGVLIAVAITVSVFLLLNSGLI